MTPENAQQPAVGPRQSIELHSAEALKLLGSVSLGRIVFTQYALPTIRPVNHVLDDGDIIIRTHEGAALTAHTRHADGEGVVVAYEADAINPETHLGWSVVVTGYAHLVTDATEVDRYQTMLRPWVNRAMDYTVRIRPDLITGIRLTPAPEPDGARALAPGTPGTGTVHGPSD
ncbi:pyridoxamine 5'-phosphate oxidase family protein [Streptomyces albicerus]|uniref:pyridoxamine 5'-phosphate oxidase family protein n=1 Tax=Streptomyces albicerus TaxID=2569859 RepID=UPI001788BB9D|nr:pyridoxamine 5'-phosphate oxidase family protein [Streptomyces albicerus]